MKKFPPALRKIIETRFGGSQRQFAIAPPQFDRGLLNKFVIEARFPTPDAVGRLAAKLPTREGDGLIKAYLQDVARHINAERDRSR